MPPEKSKNSGFNWTSLTIGAVLLVIWTILLVRTAPTMQVRRQYPIIVIGFGAVLTLLLLKLASYRPAAALSALCAVAATSLAYALFLPSLPPPVAGIVIIVPGAALALLAYRYIFRPLPIPTSVLSPQQLAVIFTILAVGICSAFVTKITIESASEFWKDEWRLQKWLPPHWLPKHDAKVSPDSPSQPSSPADFADKGAANGWLSGRSKIPWTAWLTGRAPGAPPSQWTFPLFFWVMVVLTFEFFFLLVALAFRKRYVEEERLSFPMAQFPITLIGDGTPEYDRALFRRRATWIAFAIGFVLCAYPLLRVGATGYARIEPDTTFTLIPAIRTQYDFTGYKIFSGVVCLVWLSPFVFLFVIFSPLEVLSTTVITFFVTRVLLGWIVEGLALQDQSLPGYLTRGIVIGGIFGLAFWSVVFNAGTIARLSLAFFKRTRGPDESASLFSARNFLLAFWAASLILSVWIYPRNFGPDFQAPSRWLLLAGTAFVILYSIFSRRRETVDPADDSPLGGKSLVLLTACMALSFIALTLPGRSVALLCGSSAVVFAFVFGGMRVQAESPFIDMDIYRAGRIDATIQARYLPGPSAPGIAAPENRWWNTAPGAASQFFTWGFASFFRIYGPQNWFLGAFKVGHESGASTRDIFRAIVLGLVLGSLLAAPLTLRTSYTYGYISGRPVSAWYEDTFTWMNRTYIFGTSSMEPPRHYDVYKIYTLPLLCFILVGVLMYMRREYAWFPFHPVGFVLGGTIAGSPGNVEHFWFTLLIAYAFKKLIFKWFGVRFFRQKVRPVLVFAMLGMVLAIALYLLRFTLEYHIGLITWR